MTNHAAIIFDMDGLLIDSEQLSCKGWIQAAGEWNYEMTDKIYGLVTGRTVPDAKRIFLEVYGQNFPFDEIRRRRVEITSEYYRQHGIPLKPGVPEILDLVDDLKLPRALATSTDRKPAMEKLTKSALLPRFDAIVTGDEVRNGKPSPDIFLLAASRIGIAPERCMVLEDSEAGIRAAHAAGMTPVMVPDIIQPTGEIRDLAAAVVNSLYDVCTLLRENTKR